MELKKAIKCKDGTYVEGTSAELASKAYRYDYDFSDKNLEEIREFATVMKDENSANIMKWMLESRRETSAGQIDLGQIKIDMYKGTVTEPFKDGDWDVEISKEPSNNTVLLVIRGVDEDGRTWSAATAFTLDEFLNFEEGSLGSIIGQTAAYNTIYDEDEEN